MDDLKTWVQGGPERTRGEGWVMLDMTHNYIKNQYIEIPFETDWTIATVKNKVYQRFGTSPEHMTLFLNGAELTNEGALLSQYNPKDRDVLHCVDNDPYSSAKGGALEDVSLVKKYEMTDEEYDARENTYRAFKKKMLAKDPNWVPKHVQKAREQRAAQLANEPDAETLEEANARMAVGDRCEAIGGRRGEIKYIGYVDEIKTDKNHIFVGIEFDEPEGKHDGEVRGKRYFQARAGHGVMLKSFLVKAGDFPEVDPFASDEDEDEEL